MRALQEPLVRLDDKPGTQNNETGQKEGYFGGRELIIVH